MINTELFREYSRAISESAIDGFSGSPLPSSLLMQNEADISVYYAPFDYVNTNAKLVIVGITPGLTQALAALKYAGSALAAGQSTEQILAEAKRYASFSGPMRRNLIELMDSIGLNRYLNLGSTAALFEEPPDLVHFTSIFRYPVFVNGKNYNGSPAPQSVSVLQDSFQHFCSEAEALKSAFFLPLGKLPNEMLNGLTLRGTVCEKNVLFGMPHPSGANLERINYFLRKKKAEALSRLTNPAPIDNARNLMIKKLAISPEGKGEDHE